MSWSYLLTQWWFTPAMGVTAGIVAFIACRRFLSGSTPQTSGNLPEPAAPAVDPFVGAALGERRVAARRKGNSVEIELLDPQGNTPPVLGWVVNRSLGGLCLEVEQAISEGAKVKIKIRNKSVNVEPLGVVVKSCHIADSGWQLNCQFVVTPSFNVLLLFG